MLFKLFYKSYDYKPSLNAMKMFEQATKKDLWSSLLKYMVAFTQSRADGDSVAVTIAKCADVLTFNESAHLFYALAKQENSTISFEEIEDAMFNAGILPNEDSSDFAEPYPFVLYSISLDIHEYHQGLASKKKP